MNRNRILILSSRVRALVKFQCRGFCEKKQTGDMIGPADPVSNLRPVKYVIPENETPAERELRNYKEELQKWNILFWTNHNINFIKEKKEFERRELGKKAADDQILNAREISVFYKKFLDENWETHLKYLFEWYKRNFYATFLHFKVNVLKLFKNR